MGRRRGLEQPSDEDQRAALLAMPGAKVKAMVEPFVAAGHEPEEGLLRCSKCGTTVYDFLHRGKLPCLL